MKELLIPTFIGEVEVIATAKEVYLEALKDLNGAQVIEAMDVYSHHLTDESLPQFQREAIFAAFNDVFRRVD